MKGFPIRLVLAALALAIPAMAQSFNVDISTDGSAAPSDSFGAAANQPGKWNNLVDVNDPGDATLAKLDGSATAVKVKFPGFGFTGSKNSFSGDFAKLVSDYHYTIDINKGLFYEISGLEKGVYVVYVYSNRPGDDGTSMTSVSIAGKNYAVYGTMKNGEFKKGVTHAVGIAKLDGSQKLTIGAMLDDTAGIISGFQLVKVPSSSRIYVDATATGANDGSSWADAYTNLFTAMQSAAYTGTVSEIWVAEGTYFATPDNSNAGDRDDSFVMPDGVKVYGGFAGNESSIDQRIIRDHETILSANLGDNDGFTGNSYHIVRATSVGSETLLDGFTLANGFADGSGDDANGPCMWISDSFLNVRNCLFYISQAKGDGGAVYVSGDSSPVFVGNTFYDCYCLGYGGAIRYNLASSYTMMNWNNRYILNGCAASGGAINITGGSLWCYNGVFIANFADNHAGAARIWGGLSFFGNCTFYSNEAKTCGAVESAADADTRIWNTIVYGNRDDDNGTDGEAAQLYGYYGGTLNAQYSLIQNWSGNIPGNECFSAWPGWRNIPGPDGVIGTLDDDVTLSQYSKCIDRAANYYAFTDWLDLDADGNDSESTPFDYYGAARMVDDPATSNYDGDNTIIDIGASEFVPLNYGDMNCDGSVDFNDIDPFVQSLADPSGYAADYPFCNILNGDIDHTGDVNFNDIDGFVTCLVNNGCP